MSFKDLESRNHPPRQDTPEEAELRERAAARHRAKEEKAARAQDHRRAGKTEGGEGKREPRE